MNVESPNPEKAKIARVFIVGYFSRKFENAKYILKEISKIDFKADYFITPSAFMIMPWRFSNFNEATREALMWADKLMKGIEIDANHIFIGVDSYSSLSLKEPHVELSVICSPEPWHCTGKIYPTVEQEEGLVRADIESHFVDLGEKVTILCCHDLSIFNPRTDKVVTGWRKYVKEEFKSNIKEFRPKVCVHHTHYTDTHRTWLISWKKFEEISKVKHYATAGVYYRKGGERAKLNVVLKNTKKGAVLDVIVHVE
ncbi:MAG: hypothetical protein ACTSYM_00890 [Candidatus Baldrarchaeia archaeon]